MSFYSVDNWLSHIQTSFKSIGKILKPSTPNLTYSLGYASISLKSAVLLTTLVLIVPHVQVILMTFVRVMENARYLLEILH